jgi:hypothetical protein
MPKPWDAEIVKAADGVRAQLLQFRLERYSSISPRMIPGAEKLRPRSRDLLSSLLAPLQGVEVIEQLLLAYFIGTHDPSTRDLLSPVQAALVAALFEFAHLPTNVGFVQVKDITEVAIQVLVATGERFQLNPRATSDILTSIGFGERRRTNQGAMLPFDKATVCKIHRLKRTHEVQWPQSEGLRTQMDQCNFCKDEQAANSIGSNE